MKGEKHILLRFAGWAMSIGAVGYLVWQMAHYSDYPQLWESLVNASVTGWIGLSIAILLVPMQIGCEVRRWQWLLHGLVTISRQQAMRQILRGMVAAFITPYRLGEFPARLANTPYDWDEWKTAMGSWKEWLKDWKKWLHVVLWTIFRYTVWMTQLWFVLQWSGVALSVVDALCTIPVYYLLISIMPSVPAADVPIKGGWATLIFAPFTNHIPNITVAIMVIWLINTVIPMLLGSFMQKK